MCMSILTCALCFTVAETEESTVNLRGRSGAKKTGSQGVFYVYSVCVSTVLTCALYFTVAGTEESVREKSGAKKTGLLIYV